MIGHSRIPVYRGSIDEPVGVVTLKDIPARATEGRLELTSIIHRRSLSRSSRE